MKVIDKIEIDGVEYKIIPAERETLYYDDGEQNFEIGVEVNDFGVHIYLPSISNKQLYIYMLQIESLNPNIANPPQNYLKIHIPADVINTTYKIYGFNELSMTLYGTVIYYENYCNINLMPPQYSFTPGEYSNLDGSGYMEVYGEDNHKDFEIIIRVDDIGFADVTFMRQLEL